VVRASDASGEDQGPKHQHEPSLAPSNVDLPYDYKQRVLFGDFRCPGTNELTHTGEMTCAHCYNEDCDTRL